MAEIKERTNTESILNFVFWIWNHNGIINFIEDCWKDTHLIDHLKQKWHTAAHNAGDGYASPAAIFKFIAEIDNGNRLLMFEWIEKNYDSRRS
jgi:hypothetical protein